MRQKQDNTDSAPVSPKVLHYLSMTLRERDIDVAKDDLWRAYCPGGQVSHTWRPTFGTLKDLVERALDLSGDKDLGIAVGKHISFGTFALLLPALLTCSTLLEALRVGLRYQVLTGSLLAYNSGFTLKGHGFVDVKSRFRDSSIRRFLVQMEMYVFITVAHFLTTEPKPFVRIETSYAPADIAGLRRHAACPVEPTAGSNRLYLPTSGLTERLPRGDPYVLREVIEILESTLHTETSTRNTVHMVEAMLLRSLPHVPAVAEVAATLGMSPRSLRRRLTDANTSYRALVEHVRLDRARQRISEGKLTQTEIAYEVGFESPRSLRRLLRSKKQ